MDFDAGDVTVLLGDCVEVLAGLEAQSVDAVVTDPPYGLEFMGKDWDRPWAVSPTQSVGFAGRASSRGCGASWWSGSRSTCR